MPSTSTSFFTTKGIDWCEVNYEVTPLIAEFWNTTSSLLFCVAGISICLQSRVLMKQRRLPFPLYFAGPLLILLGLASAIFHATLTLPWQRADEAMENAALAALFHGTVTSTNISRYNHFYFIVHLLSAMIGVVVFSSLLFAEIHVVTSALSVGNALIVSRDACEDKNTKTWKRKTPIIISGRIHVALICAALGGVAWVIDRIICPTTLLFNPQLHAWWHIGGAIALHEAFNAAAIAATVLDHENPHASVKLKAYGLLSVIVMPGESISSSSSSSSLPIDVEIVQTKKRD